MNDCFICLIRSSKLLCTTSSIYNIIDTKCTCLKLSSRRIQEENIYHKICRQIYYIMVCNDNGNCKIVLHQWIMYSGVLGENNTTWFFLPGKQSKIVDSNNVREISLICDNY